MRLKSIYWLFFIIFIGIDTPLADDIKSFFQYVSPLPDARLVSRETNIILGYKDISLLNSYDLSNIAMIDGSISGNNACEVLLSDDRKTIILEPLMLFAPGETVTVTLKKPPVAVNDVADDRISYSFTISPKQGGLLSESAWDEIYYEFDFGDDRNKAHRPNEGLVLDRDVSLPSDFLPVGVHLCDRPDSGYIFLCNYFRYTPYLMILDNTGHPIFYRKLTRFAHDFKKQPNNTLTYIMKNSHKFHALDSTYTVIDSFQCGNGYQNYTDVHDIQIIDNNHVLLIAYDPQTIDMSRIVPCGLSNAVVIGLIIQELDENKNVVFQWRSWDHFEITDAMPDISLCGSRIDYCHGNAIELDDDGNLLLSSRHLDEITKINRQTGDIIWRLGGENNEFTFINDPLRFSHQHDIRRIDNGNITLFDNGVFHTPQFSRAVEYELDEVNKIATLVWEFRDTPDSYGQVNGNVQRLTNGNTMIGWGGPNLPTLTEVHPDSTKAFELSMSTSPQCWAYRSFRFPWHGVADIPYLLAEEDGDYIHLIFNKFGDTNVLQYYIYVSESPAPTAIIDSTTDTHLDIDYLYGGRTYHFRVTAVDSQMNVSGFSNEVIATMPENGAPLYLPGDVNGDGYLKGSDVTYGINFFTGSGFPPLDSLWNPETESWLYSAADANGDCDFAISDIIYLVQYYLSINPVMLYCPETPPDN